MSFWEELKRRNVVRVGMAYLVAAWLVLQVVDVLNEPLNLPDWFATVVILLIAIGLPFALILSWAYELTPEGLKKSDEVSEAESITRTTGRRIDRAIITVLALAIVILVVDNYVLNISDADTGVLPDSVAVLLCDNLSPDPDDAYFAASLHEEILNHLVKLRNLNVIARTSVLRYSDSPRPIPEIANDLRVESVMECSVSYADDRIAITAQLIDGDSGVHLWSERYNRAFEDVFGIQSDIAMNIANALAVEFSLEEQLAIERPSTDSPQAYALYLQAKDNVDGVERIRLLGRALQFDPDFALAHFLKANTHASFTGNTIVADAVSGDELEEHSDLAQFHAERAVSLDPRLAYVVAATRIGQWRWSELLDALEGAPDPLQQAAVWIYSLVGDHETALTRGRRGLDLNPNEWGQAWTLGFSLMYAGQESQAAEVLRRAIEMAPTIPVLHWHLAYAEIQAGNRDVAYQELQLAEQLMAEDRRAVALTEIAYAYSRLDRADDANRIVTEIDQLSVEVNIGSGGRAMVGLALGDRDLVLNQLELAVQKVNNNERDEGFWNLMIIKANLLRDPLLDQPEYVRLRDRLSGV